MGTSAIELRELTFTFDAAAVPRDWCNGDPFATTFLAALSLLFPDGERFFMEAVKAARPAVRDPALRAQIAGFLGQEAMHGRAHRALDRMLVDHGYDMAPQIEDGVRRFLASVRRAISPASQLASTCALEHFTALLAEALLRDPALRDEIDPAIRPVWLWHALEESEHKAVAYDVYAAAGHGYPRRAITMVATTVVFFAVTAAVHARLMARRGILHQPWRWARGLTRMWLSPGYLRRLVPGYVAYFAPRFHPDDRDTRALLEAWRTTLFGGAAS